MIINNLFSQQQSFRFSETVSLYVAFHFSPENVPVKVIIIIFFKPERINKKIDYPKRMKITAI